MIVIYNKLSKRAATRAYKGIVKWFEDHPTRRVCRTEYFKVRRNHIAEDLLPHCVDGCKLPTDRKE